MAEDEPSADRPRYCPYCGEPVGWFFGRFTAGGGVWCERIEEGTPQGDRTFSDNEDSDTGEQPSEGRETP